MSMPAPLLVLFAGPSSSWGGEQLQAGHCLAPTHRLLWGEGQGCQAVKLIRMGVHHLLLMLW